ncbi:MAG: NACHT domain-containing protein [Thermogemmatispora sp.]|uniref:NACHT domain-containing protein n=1 Tax=Thermogemmatispora sp. TaxID=1968838 RepID=UPI0026096E19|nr:NACHT domain-containing protein [Thermogemmatispora sp.]MBX5455608.1 NACHT domain-containing protein [Thermogemmatispora sp.]
MTTAETKAALVFLCAAARDKRFVEELRNHLQTPALRSRLRCFASLDVPAGRMPSQEVEQAARQAQVAVVLVSAELLSGRKEEQKELNLLLQQWQLGRLLLIPVWARACSLSGTPLEKLKFIDERSCAEMRRAERDQLWVKVTEATCAALEAGEGERSTASMGKEELEALCVRVEERYRRALLEDRSLTLLQVLGMRTPFPIEQIYIRLRLHEKSEMRYLSPEEWGEQFDPEHVERRRQRRLEKRALEALEPQEAVRRHPRCVILGDPGAGKTTLLRHLAICMLRGREPDLPPVPVYLSLNAFAASGQENLLTYAVWRLARDYADYGLEEAELALYLRARLEEGKTLFLLDALDETLIGESAEEAGQSYSRVVEAVQRLANRSAVVVTARRAGYRSHRRLAGFDELDVLDFRWEEIKQFVQRWFAQESSHRPQARAEGVRLLRELYRQSHLLTLAANPLLLTLIVLTYEGSGELPARRAALYRECVTLLLERWDRERNIRRMGGPLHLRPDHHRHLLYELAWQMHLRGWRYAPRAALEEWIADFLPRLWLISGPELASQVLEALSDDCGLLREQGQDLYGFLHLTLQEYCAACYVSESGSVDLLLPYLGDPWWEEVTLLYAGAVNDATPLFRALLEGSKKAPPEDLFRSKLLLAGRCLLAQPLLRGWPELRRELPNRLFDELQQTPYRLMQQLLANVLLQLGFAYKDPVLGSGDESIIERLKDISLKGGSLLIYRAIRFARSGKEFSTLFFDDFGDISVFDFIIGISKFEDDIIFDERDFDFSAQIKNDANIIDAKIPSVGNYPIYRRLSLLEKRLEKQNITRKMLLVSFRKAIQSGDQKRIVDVLLSLVRAEELTVRFRSDCVLVLARVLDCYDDDEAVRVLLSLVKNKKLPEKVRYDCINLLNNILVKCGDEKAIEVLLSLVRDKKLPVEMHHNCVKALNRVLSSRGDGEAVEVLLSLVRDEQLAMMSRLACVETLGHLAKEVAPAQTGALAALADVGLHSEVRAALALALGESGERLLAAPLRLCWEREQDERLKRTLLLALVCLDDQDLGVLAQGEELALQGHTGGFLTPSESSLWDAYLPEYLAKHSSAETLGRLLRRSRFLRGWFSGSLIKAIETAERRDLVPVLLDVLEHSSLRAEPTKLRGVKLQGIIRALSQLGETPEVARRLLALFQRAVTDATLPVGYWVVDYLFEALWHVTRRAGLLVVERPRGSQRYVLLPRRS